MTRNVADDASNPNKSALVAADKFMIIDTETNPNSLKEILLSGLLASSAEVLTGTDALKLVTPDTLNDILTRIPVSGGMINGKISATVVSNDLVLALKTLAGSDPSAADPVYININGTIRTVTAATSCTLADGTNWFNSGAAELGTLEIDYFAYAIWDSNSSVVAIAPARIPYGRLVSDFSATTTNEKHIGNYANYTTTDDVCVIGRFAATLSLSGTSHLWTVPTFTSANLIQRPIHETRWLTWAPTLTGFSSAPTSTVYNYKFVGDLLFIISRQGANGTSNTTGFTETIPWTPSTAMDTVAGVQIDNGAVLTTAGRCGLSTNTVTFFKDMSNVAASWTASGGKRASFEAFFPA